MDERSLAKSSSLSDDGSELEAAASDIDAADEAKFLLMYSSDSSLDSFTFSALIWNDQWLYRSWLCNLLERTLYSIDFQDHDLYMKGGALIGRLVRFGKLGRNYLAED